tara:strand:+ start:394 stop:1437 length:1044 start_codon:yes stop_codon:yes gene_type:complete
MRYRDIKLVEALGPEVLARTISVQFDRDCKDVNRLNNNLTSLRRNIEKNPSSLNSIVTALKATGHNALANLLSQTTFPLTFNKDTAHSMPAYTADMCGGNGIAGTSQGNNNGVDRGNTSGQAPGNNIATGDGTTANGGGITGIPGNQNNTGVTGNGQGSNKLKAAADELERRLNAEDWQGANDLINGNPDLQATVPSSLKKDLDAAVQAQTDAAESNRLAQEAADAKVAADKKAAQDKADTEAQAAAEAAAESNRLAQEEKRLADEAEQKRNATAKAEADAAEAKRQSDAAEAKRLADAAEANRKAAKQLEADKEEAAKAAADAKTGSTPPTENPTTNQDSFDWEDL